VPTGERCRSPGPWNHWPVGLNPSDGRYAVSDDRVTHAALGGADDCGETILYGFTDKPAGTLATLGRSWNNPPTIDKLQGCRDAAYDPAQRAYRMTATAAGVSFALEASKDSPICNPCFVIEGWRDDAKASVTVNGRAVEPGKAFRQGIVRDGEGKPVMVIYLELQSTAPAEFTIK